MSDAGLGDADEPLVELEQRFDAMHSHVVRHAANGDLAGMALEESRVTLEELQVALEELQQQNAELQEAHSEIERQRRRYEELFEHAPDPYLVTDELAVIRRVNRRARELLGIGTEEGPGKPLAVYVAGDDRPEFRRLVRSSVDGAVVEGGRLTIVRRHGGPVEVIATIVNASSEGELRWTLRADTQVVDAGPRTETLLRMAAHDLRSPLSVMLATGETLELHADALTAEQVRLLGQKVHQASRRASQFVDDFVAVHGAIGGVRGESRSLVVADVIENVVTGGRQGQEVTVRCTPPDLTVTLTPLNLEHIVANLLANVARHTPPGTRAWVDAALDDEGYLRIAVSDDGPGVDPDRVPTLFEGLDDREGGGGWGLGLAVVRELAERHGGAVWYEPGETGGARFLVTLATDTPSD